MLRSSLLALMPETLPNLLTPQGENHVPNAPKGPDLGNEVRSAIPGIEKAIEVTSTKASGTAQSDDAKNAQSNVQKQQAESTLHREPPLEELPETILIKRTAALLKEHVKKLDLTATMLVKSKSPSRAHQLTSVIAQMRALHISLIKLYRMAIGNVRELYTKLRG
ncbi:hypothetical protein COW46_00630 [Candidatus Gracilibacteria bacterium CG17_big_fil_post_rev_8_21_14_2_50_48_13]|nr:MAG: hypothetical protein COW46_00630 [Candidatus Gracilibacteria bacterium CG17_big_fil_post_rev_8_21_14_2_50_48_13]